MSEVAEQTEGTEPETTGVQEVVVTKSGEKGDRQIKVPFDFGCDLDEYVLLYGADVAHDNASGLTKIGLQAFVRRHLKSEDPFYSDEDILAKVADWKPGVKVSRGKSPEEKALALLSGLSPEDLTAVLQKLQAKQAA